MDMFVLQRCSKITISLTHGQLFIEQNRDQPFEILITVPPDHIPDFLVHILELCEATGVTTKLFQSPRTNSHKVMR